MDFSSLLASVIDQGVKYVRYTQEDDKEETPFTAKTKKTDPFLEALKPKPSKGLMEYTPSANSSMQEKIKKADAVGLDIWNSFNPNKKDTTDYTEMWSSILAR